MQTKPVRQRLATKPDDGARDQPHRLNTWIDSAAKFSGWILAGLVILAVIFVRVRLLGIPLERDEGEYAYTGQLMLRGIPPYSLAANMKLPGTDAAYALIMAVFGQSAVGIHLGYLLVNAGAALLLYFLGRRLFDARAGLAAASAYALLSVGKSVLGTAAHATNFVVLPALGGILLLLRWAESRRPFTLVWSGILFGVAFLMKQPGLFFAVFGGLYVLWTLRHDWRNRAALASAALFGFCVAAPYVVTCAILWRLGVFASFWFWTVTYARQYASLSSPSTGAQLLGSTLPPILSSNPGIWILAAAGLAVEWWRRTFLLTALLGCSILAVSVGLFFRPHYFILVLPAVALLAAAGVHAMRARIGPAWAFWLCAAVFLWSVAQQKEYLFDMDSSQAARAMYGLNPFPEAVRIGEYLATHSAPDSRVAILGSEPEILFYARRESATRYIYTYGLMEPQPLALQMQNEMIADIETSRPEFVVFVNTSSSWLRTPQSVAHIFDWWRSYAPNYEIQGVVDILDGETVYRWGQDARGYRARSSNFIVIGERKKV